VLFSPGPVNLRPEIKDNLFNVELCHRQPEFEDLYERVAAKLFNAAGFSPRTHRLSLLPGSGTTAVDAGMTSLVRGRVLVVNNGFYCDRLTAAVESVEKTVVSEHRPGMGAPPDLEALDTQLSRDPPDWLAVVHHETSTGLLNPLPELAELAARHGCRLFVDAVSSLPAHPIPGTSDVACFNSNKCLESLPGIAGVFWGRDLEARALSASLDVAAYADSIPTTPNVQAFVALDVALDLLAAEDRPDRYRRLARAVWTSGGRHFTHLLPEAWRSHVLTSFRLEGRDPDALLSKAHDHGYVIYAGQGVLREEIFRVANMGAAIDQSTIEELFEVLGS
jgi:2-aminoethylphosphonate-pyruvate transaminase